MVGVKGMVDGGFVGIEPHVDFKQSVACHTYTCAVTPPPPIEAVLRAERMDMNPICVLTASV